MWRFSNVTILYHIDHDMMTRQKRNRTSSMTSPSENAIPPMKPSPSVKPSTSATASHQAAVTNLNDLQNQDLTCPFQLEEICGTCWQAFGSMAKQKGNNCHTIGYWIFYYF